MTTSFKARIRLPNRSFAVVHVHSSTPITMQDAAKLVLKNGHDLTSVVHFDNKGEWKGFDKTPHAVITC